VHRSLKTSAFKTAFENACLSSHTFHRVAEFLPEVRQVNTAQVSQLDPFELLPEALAWIQLRRIRWEALNVKALRRAIGQELLALPEFPW
jgi:hypothetical protein